MVHVTWGLIIACGRPEQLQPSIETPFLNLGSRPVLAYVLQAFEQCPDVLGVLVVADKTRCEAVAGMAQMLGYSKVRRIVPGGVSRQTSVMAGLEKLDDDVTLVCVHDATRPCVTPALISETIKAAKRYGSGVAAVPATDAVKVVERGQVVSQSFAPGTAWIAQTPQSFLRDRLEKAYIAASKKRLQVADDAEAYALTRHEVHLVQGSPKNIKIREPQDLNEAARYLNAS
jgi:2-C-methyl-D-erythritol 4-phosphate cytidylyltransferase